MDEVKFRLAMCVARFQLMSLVEILNVPINGLGLHSAQSGLLINSPELPIDLGAVFFWIKNTLFLDENFIQEYLKSYSVTKQLGTQREGTHILFFIYNKILTLTICI